MAFRPEREEQLREVLKKAGNTNIDHVVMAIKQMHSWLSEGGCLKRGVEPEGGINKHEWEIAYNLQPQLPLCERK